MSPAETALLEQQLTGKQAYLEFGCGGSTLLAGRCRVAKIVSVDSDPEWLDSVKVHEDLAACVFTPFRVDIGPVGDWGYPVDTALFRNWPRYHAQVWRHISGSPDMVLVDGRFRIACILQSILHCGVDTVIAAHDFWSRPQYHGVLSYLDEIDRAETLGIFRRKAEVDWKALLAMLFDHCLDPE